MAGAVDTVAVVEAVVKEGGGIGGHMCDSFEESSGEERETGLSGAVGGLPYMATSASIVDR